MRADLVKHAVAGFAWGALGWVIWLACWIAGYVGSMDGAPVMAATCAGVAGAVKEAADKLDNDLFDKKLHDVSGLDFLFTFAPGLLLAAVLHHATR